MGRSANRRQGDVTAAPAQESLSLNGTMTPQLPHIRAVSRRGKERGKNDSYLGRLAPLCMYCEGGQGGQQGRGTAARVSVVCGLREDSRLRLPVPFLHRCL